MQHWFLKNVLLWSTTRSRYEQELSWLNNSNHFTWSWSKPELNTFLVTTGPCAFVVSWLLSRSSIIAQSTRISVKELSMWKIISSDESRVYGCDLETKQQWTCQRFTRQKKSQQTGATKSMQTVFFDIGRVVHRGQTVNTENYCEPRRRLRGNIWHSSWFTNMSTLPVRAVRSAFHTHILMLSESSADNLLSCSWMCFSADESRAGFSCLGDSRGAGGASSLKVSLSVMLVASDSNCTHILNQVRLGFNPWIKIVKLYLFILITSHYVIIRNTPLLAHVLVAVHLHQWSVMLTDGGTWAVINMRQRNP